MPCVENIEPKEEMGKNEKEKESEECKTRSFLARNLAPAVNQRLTGIIATTCDLRVS